jgi:hypothetical protein
MIVPGACLEGKSAHLIIERRAAVHTMRLYHGLPSN